MSPETYSRLQNTSKEDFDRFIDWLFSHTLAEVREARRDSEATRAAWVGMRGRQRARLSGWEC